MKAKKYLLKILEKLLDTGVPLDYNTSNTILILGREESKKYTLWYEGRDSIWKGEFDDLQEALYVYYMFMIGEYPDNSKEYHGYPS